MRDAAIGLVILALFALLVVGLVMEAKEWNAYKAAHNCKVVGKMDGSHGFGISTSGKGVTTYTPGKTGWLCDDGITYWK